MGYNIDKNLKLFCEKYDVLYRYLDQILEDPKVVPMIRGKSFEYHAKEKLSKQLGQRFKINNLKINSSINTHDSDIQIILPDQSTKLVECKLTSKGGFKIKDNHAEIKVKCMKSRTSGKGACKKHARKWGVSVRLVEIHSDQYRASDFDYVITTIGNTFYSTDSNGFYYWNPSSQEKTFLKKINANSQQKAYEKLYIAKSLDLICTNNPRKCTRRKCQGGCNFIPNYPKIIFPFDSNIPNFPWIPIEHFQLD